MRASRSGCRNRGASAAECGLGRSAAECGLGRSAAEHGLANRRGTRFGVLPRMTLSQLPRPCFGFPTPTVQRSTEPPLRGKAPASPLTAAPAEMRQEVRPCVSFLAMPLAGRNRPVSTMGVYQPRQRLAAPQPSRPTVPDAPSRRGVAASPSGRAGSMTPPRPIRRARLAV